MTLSRHIVVTGMPQVGKSTITGLLAERLRLPRRDSDEDLATLFGVSGRELADRYDVDGLHRLEAAVLLGALVEPEPHVIAAAGSIIDDRLCRTALDRRSSLFVLVGAPTAVAGTDHRRPIDADEMRILLSRREPLWQRHAAAIIDGNQPVDDIVAQITASLV